MKKKNDIKKRVASAALSAVVAGSATVANAVPAYAETDGSQESGYEEFAEYDNSYDGYDLSFDDEFDEELEDEEDEEDEEEEKEDDNNQIINKNINNNNIINSKKINVNNLKNYNRINIINEEDKKEDILSRNKKNLIIAKNI